MKVQVKAFRKEGLHIVIPKSLGYEEGSLIELPHRGEMPNFVTREEAVSIAKVEATNAIERARYN